MKIANAIPIPSLLIIAVIGLLSACGDDEPIQVTAPETSAPPTNTSSDGNAQEVMGFATTEVTQFSSPWAMTFLPDGRMLVTEMAGTLHIYDPASDTRGDISGVPEVRHVSQGGLGDVALHPDYATNSIVYISYAEPGEGGLGGALARARLALNDSGDRKSVV